MMTPIKAEDFANMSPSTLYPIAVAAKPFGVKGDTLQNWCEARGYPLSHSPSGRRFVHGIHVLAIAGEMLARELPLERETDKQAEARGRAALAELLKPRKAVK